MKSRQSKPGKLKEMAKQESRLANAYAKVRGSVLFLIGLVTLIVTWVSAHFLLHVDQEFGALNLILSSEASIALAFFTMMAADQDKRTWNAMEYHQKQLEHMVKVAEAVYALVAELSKIETKGVKNG